MSEKNNDFEFDNTEVLDLRRNTDDEFKTEKVKDNWWDESEEEKEDEPKPAPETTKAPAVKSTKKKSAKEKAEEREVEKKREQEMIRLQLAATNRTAEEIAAEKARIQKEQEDSDFAMARDTFSSEPVDSLTGIIDGFEPNDLESFDKFRSLLVQKILKSQSSDYFSGFLNSLFQDLSLHMPAEDVRRYGSTLTTLAGEKAKQEKEKAGKGKPKLKKKTPGLSTKKDDSMVAYDDEYDEMDDMF